MTLLRDNSQTNFLKDGFTYVLRKIERSGNKYDLPTETAIVAAVEAATLLKVIKVMNMNDYTRVILDQIINTNKDDVEKMVIVINNENYLLELSVRLFKLKVKGWHNVTQTNSDKFIKECGGSNLLYFRKPQELSMVATFYFQFKNPDARSVSFGRKFEEIILEWFAVGIVDKHNIYIVPQWKVDKRDREEKNKIEILRLEKEKIRKEKLDKLQKEKEQEKAKNKKVDESGGSKKESELVVPQEVSVNCPQDITQMEISPTPNPQYVYEAVTSTPMGSENPSKIITKSLIPRDASEDFNPNPYKCQPIDLGMDKDFPILNNENASISPKEKKEIHNSNLAQNEAVTPHQKRKREPVPTSSSPQAKKMATENYGAPRQWVKSLAHKRGAL